MILSMLTACAQSGEEVQFDGNYLVTTPQVYISKFADIKPGDNDPATGNTDGPQIDILTVNETKGVPVNIQHVITVYAKAITDSGAANVNEYLDGSAFYICDTDGKEAEDKYFILQNKTAVQASEYSEENDGDIIAVRYYLPGQSIDKPSDDKPSFTVDSYLLGLSSEVSSDYELPSAEMNVSIKTQASIGDVTEETDWSTIDSISLYSDRYNGSPIDTSLVSFNPYVNISSEPETNAEANTEETEPVQITLPPDAETLSPVTEAPSTEDSDLTETAVSTETDVAPITETESQTEVSTEATTTAAPSETTAKTTTSAQVVYPEGMSITNSNGQIDLNVGESFTVQTAFTPENTTETSLTCVSSDTNVATVDSNGTITAIGAGSASVSLTSVNGMTLTVNVTVKAEESAAPTEPSSVRFDVENVTLNAGETYDLSVVIEPQNIGNVSVTWSTTDANVATILSGTTITAVGSGTATITLTTANGLSTSCTVTVR